MLTMRDKYHAEQEERRREYIATHDMDEPLPEGTVWIWDNGGEYSDHALHFIDVSGFTPAELFELHKPLETGAYSRPEFIASVQGEFWEAEPQSVADWANNGWRYYARDEKGNTVEPIRFALSDSVLFKLLPAWMATARRKLSRARRMLCEDRERQMSVPNPHRLDSRIAACERQVRSGEEQIAILEREAARLYP